MLDTVDLVRELIARRDYRTPIERQVVDLLKAMIASGLTEHHAFDALYELHGYLTMPGEIESELHLHRIWEGELVEGAPGRWVDMVEAQRLYRHWCKLHGVKRASMARNSKVVDGKKQDCPCLVYVSRRLKQPSYVVAEAWRGRKKLTK